MSAFATATTVRAHSAPLPANRLIAALAVAGAFAGVLSAAAWPIDIASKDGASLYAAAKVPGVT